MSAFTKREQCPVCAESNKTVLYSIPYDSDEVTHYLEAFYRPQGKPNLSHLKGEIFELSHCSNCDLTFQSNVPNDALLFELYEVWIDPNLALVRDQEKDPSYQWMRLEEVSQMIDHFNPKLIKNLKVLDFGMGWGSLLLMFKALGTQCYGMELSQARIKEAKAKGLQILSKEEVGNHEFDIIVLNDVLEHLTHPRETLAWLAKHLKTDGIIKISVPNAAVHKKALAAMNWHAPRGTELNLNGISPMEHLNLFSNKTLNIAAQQAGLKPIKLKSAITINAKRSLKSSPLKSLAREHIKRIKPTNLYFSKT